MFCVNATDSGVSLKKKEKKEKDIDIYEYIKCENHGIGCERMFSAILFCSRESEI